MVEVQDMPLETVISNRHKQLASEIETEDIDSIIMNQMNNDERLLDSLLQILCLNDKIKCDLLPTIATLIKVANSSNHYVIRNKVINVISFLVKAAAQNDDESLSIFFPSSENLNKKKLLLILIGTLRILIKSNKKLIKHFLKSFLSKEEYFKNQGAHIMKKQIKAIQSKSGTNNQQVLPPLSEIFMLVRAPVFKTDKVLMKNLTLFIH